VVQLIDGPDHEHQSVRITVPNSCGIDKPLSPAERKKGKKRKKKGTLEQRRSAPALIENAPTNGRVAGSDFSWAFLNARSLIYMFAPTVELA
jgi:hypothetical protein